MLNIQDIHPLTDFLRNHKAHLKRLRETGAAEALTVNGKPEVVILDAQAYQALVERLAAATDGVRELSEAGLDAAFDALSADAPILPEAANVRAFYYEERIP